MPIPPLGQPGALEAVTVLLEATLLDATRDRARALVHLGMIDRDPTLPALPDGTSGSGLWAAVAAEAHLAVDDLGAAATQAAIVGPSAGDPVAAYLAGPAALIAAARWGAPTPDLGGYEILRSEATARSSNVPADLEEVSRQWSSIAARGVVRCTLAARHGPSTCRRGATGRKRRAGAMGRPVRSEADR